MAFILDLINDSVLLRSMEDFNEFTPDELYEEHGINYLCKIVDSFIDDYSKLEKMYSGDYNFTDEDLLFLIHQLNYIDNKYLIDMIVFAKYKESEYIESNLIEDLFMIYYREIIDKNMFKEFIKRKNINILRWINYNKIPIINKPILLYCCRFGNLEIFKWLFSIYN